MPARLTGASLYLRVTARRCGNGGPVLCPAVSDLPPFDINRLVAVRDLGASRPDHASRFIGAECRVATYAYVQSSNANARGERIGALQFLRLLCESGIRLRWICGDEDTGDETGQLVVDGLMVVERARRLEKRDLMSLRSAYVAINEASGGEGRYAGGLLDLVAAIPDEAAPPSIRDLATSWSGRSLYSMHRLCSSRVHAGALLGRQTSIETPEEIDSQLDGVGHMLTAWAE